jgi:hypothetical protein
MQDIAEDFVENVAAFACELVTLTLTLTLAVAVALSPNRARRRIRLRAGQAPRSHLNPHPYLDTRRGPNPPQVKHLVRVRTLTRTRTPTCRP